MKSKGKTESERETIKTEESPPWMLLSAVGTQMKVVQLRALFDRAFVR